MASTNGLSDLLGKASVVTTLLDAVLEFARGRKGSGLLLLVAGLISSRVRGLGVVTSVALRIYRRMNGRRSLAA